MEDAVSEAEAEAESLLHKQEEDCKRKESEAEGKGKGGEKKKGGLLDHIIHNLVSPLSPRAGDVNQKKVEVFESNINGARSEDEGSGSEEEVGNVNNGGGGLIKNVIANFFHPNEQADEVVENEEKMVKSVDQNAEVKKEDEGGGIIGDIVSYLPTSLPDYVAPTTDEASILLHSIIHD